MTKQTVYLNNIARKGGFRSDDLSNKSRRKKKYSCNAERIDNVEKKETIYRIRCCEVYEGNAISD